MLPNHTSATNQFVVYATLGDDVDGAADATLLATSPSCRSTASANRQWLAIQVGGEHLGSCRAEHRAKYAAGLPWDIGRAGNPHPHDTVRNKI